MGSPVISANWFPFDQRATATAIITVFGLSGTAFIFVVGEFNLDKYGSEKE